MHLRRLTLQNFRNIPALEAVPGPGFNVFWGDNAQGKTNLLEVIYFLGTLKSFRGAKTEDLLARGARTGMAAAEVDCQGVARRIEVAISAAGKQPRLDGKEARSAAEFFGCLRPIAFSTDEVAVTRGGPAGRRSLLDRAVFQADPAYLARVRDYDRVLRQRNSLLKAGGSAAELAPWTEALIRAGARIRVDRRRYLQDLSPQLQEICCQLSAGRETLVATYRPTDETEEGAREALSRELTQVAGRERHLGQTLAGPHRDDPEFLLNSEPLRLFASQGQQRSFILAFKAAQILDLERRLGEPPVLLLDDMTSELDRERRRFFFSFLLARKGQVFITTTDIGLLLREGFQGARTFRVRGGTLSEHQET